MRASEIAALMAMRRVIWRLAMTEGLRRDCGVGNVSGRIRYGVLREVSGVRNGDPGSIFEERVALTAGDRGMLRSKRTIGAFKVAGRSCKD